MKHNDALVVGVASMVFCGGRAYGVPRSSGHARSMLKELAGNTHSVFTGIALVHGDQFTTCVEETKVSFASISDHELEAYVKSKLALDCVGAYNIADPFGAVLIAGIVGDFYNVAGFPLRRFYRTLKRDFSDLLEGGDDSSSNSLKNSTRIPALSKSRSFSSLFQRN